MEPREFVLAKTTLRAYQFKEVVPEGKQPLFGVLYMQQSAFATQPKKIRLSTEVVE